MKRIVAAVFVAALAAACTGTLASADGAKKNQGLVSPHFAEYGVTRIGLGGLSSVERDEASEKLFQQALESAFGQGGKYRFQALGTFQDAARQAGVLPAVTALGRTALAAAAPDSAAVAALRGKLAVDAILYVHVTRMERNQIDQYTRGQSSTDVAADFALVAVKDGAILWHGNFAERGLGPYNDPNTADVPERDPTGNSTAHSDALDPPPFRDVLDKLMRTAIANLPSPAAAPTAAAPAPGH